jgi:L-serine dehydratase
MSRSCSDLAGEAPETVDPDRSPKASPRFAPARQCSLGGSGRRFRSTRPAISSSTRQVPRRPCQCDALHRFPRRWREEQATYFSIGGGAILREGEPPLRVNFALRHPFSSAAELLAIGDETGLSIGEIVDRQRGGLAPADETDAFLDAVRAAMLACIDRGLKGEGILPGGLNVQRRARRLHDALIARGPRSDPSLVFEWVSLWALAVNEENAAGGRVVTAPTNGAAGVLPAVLKYYEVFVPRRRAEGSRLLLTTAAAIGFLYKKRASISAAEMGCQGEVGVACSMAAAGLAAALGASNAQIENAAEIGMEHNLGLTCDPIGGLVQIPCIERNTMGAIKAINAAYLALHGDGRTSSVSTR